MVYFASSNLPEDLLDGMHDGRMRWVKEFPGYKNAMPVYLLALNKTISVNKAYRQSLIYDTDGDGISNGFDLTPFGAGLPKIVDVTRNYKGADSVSMEWLAVPKTDYIVQYKENIEDEGWKTLRRIIYQDESIRPYKFSDTLSKKIQRRFFRVVVE